MTVAALCVKGKTITTSAHLSSTTGSSVSVWFEPSMRPHHHRSPPPSNVHRTNIYVK